MAKQISWQKKMSGKKYLFVKKTFCKENFEAEKNAVRKKFLAEKKHSGEKMSAKKEWQVAVDTRQVKGCRWQVPSDSWKVAGGTL